MHDTKDIIEILKSRKNTINKRILKKMIALHIDTFQNLLYSIKVEEDDYD